MNPYLDIKNNIQNTNRVPEVAQATASGTPWGAIANVASTLLGIGGSIFGNNQQMQQQQALMQQQYANQMGLNNQMAQIQRDNWDYTNYENQVKHMQNAGLNVGLMYGMSGGGGATMGGASGGSAAGGNAPQNVAPAIMEILQRQQLVESQIELNEAQANNLNADADKKRGPETENIKADTALKNVNTRLQEIEADVKGEFRYDEYLAQVNKLQSEARQSLIEANVSENTQKVRELQFGINLFKTAVEAANISQLTEESKQRIIQKAKELELQAKSLNIQEYKNKIEQFKTELQSEYPSAWNVVGKMFNDIIGYGDELIGNKDGAGYHRKMK